MASEPGSPVYGRRSMIRQAQEIFNREVVFKITNDTSISVFVVVKQSVLQSTNQTVERSQQIALEASSTTPVGARAGADGKRSTNRERKINVVFKGAMLSKDSIKIDIRRGKVACLEVYSVASPAELIFKQQIPSEYFYYKIAEGRVATEISRLSALLNNLGPVAPDPPPLPPAPDVAPEGFQWLRDSTALVWGLVVAGVAIAVHAYSAPATFCGA